MDKRELERFEAAEKTLDAMFGRKPWYKGRHRYPNDEEPVRLEVYSSEDSDFVENVVPGNLDGVIVKVRAGEDMPEMFEAHKPKEKEEEEEAE